MNLFSLFLQGLIRLRKISQNQTLSIIYFVLNLFFHILNFMVCQWSFDIVLQIKLIYGDKSIVNTGIYQVIFNYILLLYYVKYKILFNLISYKITAD